MRRGKMRAKVVRTSPRTGRSLTHDEVVDEMRERRLRRSENKWRVVTDTAGGFGVADFRTRKEAEAFGGELPRGTRWRLVDMRRIPHKIVKTSGYRANPSRRARRNPEQIAMHATPYDISARGWYFDDHEDFERKYKKHLPVEEYSIEWIDGPEEDRLLFEALDVNPANLEQFFDLVDELNDHDKAALYYLLRHRGMGPGEDLDDLLRMVEDEVRLMEGNSKEYVYEMIDSIGGVGATFSPEVIARYFDYERFGRDIGFDMDPDDEGDAYYLEMDDEERGEEYVDSMGGVSEMGKMAKEYFDIDSVVRDMEMNGELSEFDFAGKTYTTDFMG